MSKKISTPLPSESSVEKSEDQAPARPSSVPPVETESLAAGQKRLKRVGVLKCSVPGCVNLMKALDLCGGHWFRLKHYGNVMALKPLKGFRDPVTILTDSHGDYAKVQITKGYFTLVDACDHKLVGSIKWFASIKPQTVYARGLVNGKNTFLHCLIMGIAGVDHIDCDGLNNRRFNLRVATPSQNQGNRRKFTSFSRYKGVTWDRTRKAWIAQINVPGVKGYLGRFEDEKEAAIAYDNAAKKCFGSFARPNFI